MLAMPPSYYSLEIALDASSWQQWEKSSFSLPLSFVSWFAAFIWWISSIFSFTKLPLAEEEEQRTFGGLLMEARRRLLRTYLFVFLSQSKNGGFSLPLTKLYFVFSLIKRV